MRANAGYTWMGNDDDDDDDNDIIHYGLAATYQLTDKLQPVAEFVAETPTQSRQRT